MPEAIEPEEDESEFECPECGEELDDDDVCRNEQCLAYGEEPLLAESDWQARQHERKQMGIVS